MSGEISPPLSGRVVGRGEDRQFRERLGSTLEESGLVALRTSPPDFVIDLGREGVPEISTTPPLGIWRFEIGRDSAGGVRQACRAALARGEDSLVARLVAREGSDGGRRTVLREGRLPLVPYSLRRTIGGAADQLSRWPLYACQGVLATGDLGGPRTLRDEAGGRKVGRGEDAGGPADGMSASGELAFRLRLALTWIQRTWRTLFRHDHWHVGVVDRPIEDFVDMDEAPETTWLENPPRHTFRADPFGVAADGGSWVLYEEVDYRDGLGRIVAEEWREPGEPSRREVIFGGDQHLSYPYLVREDGQIYCVPETSESGRVHLFRAVEFPWRWEHAAVLLEDVAALDSTLFRHSGLWWMFATDARSGPRHVLNAWHAEALAGEWTEHARNPIKVDICSARPAGTPFRHEGRLYRPAQSGARRYGERLALNRIETLTPDQFEERTVRWISPDPEGPCPDGLHTLSRLGPDRCLVDGNRTRLSHHELVRRIRETVGI